MDEQQPPGFVERKPPPPPRTVGDMDLAPAALSYDTFLNSVNETMLTQWTNALAAIRSGDGSVCDYGVTLPTGHAYCPHEFAAEQHGVAVHAGLLCSEANLQRTESVQS